MNNGPVANLDKELWREREGDYYADSIHVTDSGMIGMNCGGYVIVRPIREWHKLALQDYPHKHTEPYIPCMTHADEALAAIENRTQNSEPIQFNSNAKTDMISMEEAKRRGLVPSKTRGDKD